MAKKFILDFSAIMGRIKIMEFIDWYFWLSFLFSFTVISYILIHIFVRMTARMVVRNMEKTKNGQV
ncbi:MAG TPA: hypothetical protein PL048_01545 [Leptospiraceae bacterium]|nr:hypothetical protein [Leptospiraceae bacterium]HNF14958.1 hypothetical protein [Leptospiraceae bacterium]HNF23824.1 hypothetical protein [Leptospiraceae bacterium]HNH08216.1 hypothetical protein [Leptospiraceae bacterium]HNI95999.1 hypothetical protein [Leptospiraceae bacterium]